MRTYMDHLSEGHSFPLSNRPSINPNHIDGPMLTFRDGQMHWLTPWERVLYRFGRIDAESLERKLRPNLMRVLNEIGK